MKMMNTHTLETDKRAILSAEVLYDTRMTPKKRRKTKIMMLLFLAVDIKVTGRWEDGGSFQVHDTIRVIDP